MDVCQGIMTIQTRVRAKIRYRRQQTELSQAALIEQISALNQQAPSKNKKVKSKSILEPKLL